MAKIMNKYLHMELGKAMSLSGMCVALSAALVYDKKTVVLSILEPILTALCWIILFLTTILSEGYVLSQKKKKNFAGSLLKNCIVELLFTNP